MQKLFKDQKDKENLVSDPQEFVAECLVSVDHIDLVVDLLLD